MKYLIMILLLATPAAAQQSLETLGQDAALEEITVWCSHHASRDVVTACIDRVADMLLPSACLRQFPDNTANRLYCYDSAVLAWRDRQR